MAIPIAAARRMKRSGRGTCRGKGLSAIASGRCGLAPAAERSALRARPQRNHDDEQRQWDDEGQNCARRDVTHRDSFDGGPSKRDVEGHGGEDEGEGEERVAAWGG